MRCISMGHSGKIQDIQQTWLCFYAFNLLLSTVLVQDSVVSEAASCITLLIDSSVTDSANVMHAVVCGPDHEGKRYQDIPLIL